MGLLTACLQGLTEWDPPTFNPSPSERERNWRARVEALVRTWEISPNDGIRAEFITKSEKRNGNYFDLDNMAACVFDSLLHQKPKYVELRRYLGLNAGVVLTVGLPEPPSPTFVCCMPLRRGSERDPAPEPALSGLQQFTGNGHLYVHLSFHEDVSFTDFGMSGAIKPTPDCLWPIIGGSFDKPHDHRIWRLVLTRSAGHSSGVCVYVGLHDDLRAE